MLADKPTDTKSEIIHSARQEFITHGFEGARMASIAEQTGVTKAMIHYYFDTKQKLFESVYRESVSSLFDGFPDILTDNTPLFKKLENIIRASLEITEQQPEHLTFIITESKRKSEWLVPIFRELYSAEIAVFKKQLEEAAERYEIASVEVHQVLLNIFSLCFYPVIASDINQIMLDTGSNGENTALVKNREGIVLDTILNWLTA